MPRARPKATVRSSWDPVAKWYAGWAGKRGSIYHKKIAIPAVLSLLELAPDESLIDIGCGHGVLASYVLRTGVSYLGVDASRRLIAHARQSQPKGARFATGDAADLASVEKAADRQFDAAVFMLSIQDMEPLERVIASACGRLAERARLVIFMLHPCFRVPRQSGWGVDPKRKLTYRRIDRYLTDLRVPMKAYGEVMAGAKGTTLSFHRPLQRYVSALTDNGLVIDRLEEYPDPISKDNPDIPLFLGMRARRLG